MNNPQIKIILKDGREINAELYPEVAPITVANFLKLIDERYFDGVIFHRVIDRFMIQTGGYYIEGNTLMEKEGAKTIKGEFASNGVENTLKHKIGVLSMARTNDPNSASGQFFICSASCAHLDGAYAAFGKVVDELSLATVLDISHVETLVHGTPMVFVVSGRTHVPPIPSATGIFLRGNSLVLGKFGIGIELAIPTLSHHHFLRIQFPCHPVGDAKVGII